MHDFNIYYTHCQGVQNIRRWTQLCDPTKKKKGDDVTGAGGGVILKLKTAILINGSNLEATILKVSEKIGTFITEFIDVEQQLAEVTVSSL